MKKLIVLLLVLCAATCYGAGYLETANNTGGPPIQGLAPDSTKDVSLTGTSVTTDMSGDLGWAVYCAADSIYRTMPTSTKAGAAKTIPSTTWHSRVINTKSPFINISGCTGKLERQ